MRYVEILNQIVSAKKSWEKRSDVLTMVHLLEPIVWASSVNKSALESDLEAFHANETRRTRAARVAGTLLCFIFSPVKHPSYSSAMEAARHNYRGIADDTALQASFMSGIEAARSRRAFRSYPSVAQILPMELNKARNENKGSTT